ncbi:DMT family transporter [Stackebrandtia soli]|uniref:DMT family transporter n=1 Tax=Stackebrandtia soli TaxID=1892856 RepID=UPI0039EBF8EF
MGKMSWTAKEWAVVAAAVTVVLWASAFVGIRMVGESFSPGALTLGRLAVGALVLGGMALFARAPMPRGRALGLIVVYGVLWFGGYNLALNAAELYLDAGTAALVVNIGPILIAVLSGLFLAEGFPRPLLIGCAIAFSGVAIIAAGGRFGDISLTGVGLALLAAVLYAAGVVAQKPVIDKVNPIQATWLGCAIGAVVTVPFAPQLVTELAAAPTSAIAGVVYLGVFPTAIAFTTWAYALRRTSAGKLGATTFLVPAVAVLLSWIAIGEVPSIVAFAGGVVCLVGVAVTRWKPRATTRPPLEPAPTPVS